MKGRNFDYGTQMSNSREGEMAKRTLITMAKDLYDLYINLNDHDDLPEWCHYKLARSQNELEAVSNYLTSKIYKYCLDNNISIDRLKKEVYNSIEKEMINEGLFDFFKKTRKSKRSKRKDIVKKSSNNNYREKYDNNIEMFAGYSKDLSYALHSGIVSNNSEEASATLSFIDKFKDSILRVIYYECLTIHKHLEVFEKTKSKTRKTTSAKRRNVKDNQSFLDKMLKKGFSRSKFSMDENIKNHVQDNISNLINRCSEYFSNRSDDVDKEIKTIYLYDVDKISIIKKKLEISIDLMNDVFVKHSHKIGEKNNDRYDR